MKKIIIAILMAVCFVVPNVYADEVKTSEFVDIDTKMLYNASTKERKILVKFTTKKLFGSDRYANRTVTMQYLINDNPDGLHRLPYRLNQELNMNDVDLDTFDFASINKTFLHENEENWKDNEEIVEYSKFKDDGDTNYKISIRVNDGYFNHEEIVYDVEANTIISVKKVHDEIEEKNAVIFKKLDAIENQILEKYKNQELDLCGMGSIPDDEVAVESEIGSCFYVPVGDNFTKEIGIKNILTKTIEQIASEIDAVLNKNEVIINSFDEENSKDILESIKTNGLIATIPVWDNDTNKIVANWVFDGSKMDTTDFNLNIDLTVGSSTNKDKIDSLLPDKKTLVFETAYHGELPKGTGLKFDTTNSFENGDLVSLYYYNDKGELELVQKDVEVKENNVVFALEHCSEYVAVKTGHIAPNNSQTSSMNILLYGGIAFVSLLGIGCLAVNKKKN